MIVDSIANAARYRGLSPAFDAVLAHFGGLRAEGFAAGRSELAEGAFANAMELATAVEGDKPFELHFAYADVHFVVEGAERLLSVPVDLGSYADEGGDCALFDAAEGPVSSVELRAGGFCIVWPGEAHKPGLAPGGAEAGAYLRKVVGKVPVPIAHA